MDALFPDAQTMEALSQVVLVFVGFGLGLSGCVWLLGYLVAFVIHIVKEV